MKTKSRLFLLFTLLSLLFVACRGAVKDFGERVTTDDGEYSVVSVEELQIMLEEKDFTLVNVHIPWQGDIPQTDLRVAYDQIAESQQELPQDKDSKILLYCLTSGMAKVAAETLVSQGYGNIWMLDGGTIAWEEAGQVLNKD